MIRSLSFVRRGLLGIAVAGTLAFGTTQALASPQAGSAPPACPIDPEGPYYSGPCGQGCPDGIGYCTMKGYCECGYIP